MYDRLFLAGPPLSAGLRWSHSRKCIATKGPIVTNDFVDVGASASLEAGAAVFGAEVGAGRLYQGG